MEDRVETGGSRRGLLAWVVRIGSVAIAAVYAIPAARYLGARRGARDADGDVVDLGPVEALPEGRPVRVAVPSRNTDAWSEPRGSRASVFLIRRGTTVVALDSACPHTGCAVEWDEAATHFRCPCHKSSFAVDGARIEGPAPRGLDPEELTVVEGRLRLRYRRSRSGRSERVPV